MANTAELDIGYYGTGNLTAANGGKISSTIGRLGYYSGSTGTATIIGDGSTWTNSGSLYVGNSGTTGGLTVADGGGVTASSVAINSGSAVTLRVSGSGMMTVGDASIVGSVSNSGKISLYADAFLTAGTYSPITESQGRTITRTGTGSYNATGGTWDNSAYNFTVLAATPLDAGVSDNNVSTGERLLVTDSATGKRAGASFGPVGSGVNFSAALMDSSKLSGVPLGNGESVRSAWDFTTNFTGGTALLAFEIGHGVANVKVWRYSGGTWAPCEATDLTYDSNGIASFTTGDVGDFAVSAVPEPATLSLLALGGLALIRRRRTR